LEKKREEREERVGAGWEWEHLRVKRGRERGK